MKCESALRRWISSRGAKQRLYRLLPLTAPQGSIAESTQLKIPRSMKTRLSNMGLVVEREQRTIFSIMLAAVVLSALLMAIVGSFSVGGVVGGCGGVFIGGYFGLLGVMIWLRRAEQEYRRRVLFFAPLVVETIILLVESGLGILPALEHVVRSSKEGQRRPDPVTRILGVVYDLSAQGMPFEEACRECADRVPDRILKHLLLHLNVGVGTGGAVATSLRSLSDHVQTEWRLSVLERVRMLETLVVFPVFLAVLGLFLLTAAVPLVPLLEMSNKMEQSQLNRGIPIPGKK